MDRGDSVVVEVLDRAADHRSGSVSDHAGVTPVLTTVYLAHPYSEKEYVERIFQPRLETAGVRVINPFIRPEQAAYERKMAAAGGANKGLDDRDCADIVIRDLEKIDRSDAIVAALMADNMIGTLMEIFYCAHVAGKPVFAWTPRQREQDSPWIRYHAITESAQPALIKRVQDWAHARTR